MKVMLYIDNPNMGSVDLTALPKGNPGIGGTEYAILSLAHELTMHNERDLDVEILSRSNLKGLPNELSWQLTENIFDAVAIKANECDAVLIIPYGSICENSKFIDAIEKCKANIVLWVHNFPNGLALKRIVKVNSVKRIVFVGKEFRERYIDHEVYEKSQCIFNGFKLNSTDNKSIVPFAQRGNVVTYIGSLIYEKGFHVLAQAWPKVLERIPDAQLYVIGGGNLYNPHAVLGSYGLADSEFEKLFMKHLTDEQGKILQSVHFMGVLGLEKIHILEKTRVGVPNPTGFSETFGYTAVEFQATGALVATKRCYGYLDTVAPSGLLYERNSQLADAIVELLLRTDGDYSTSRKFIEEKFGYSVVVGEWIELFQSIRDRKPVPQCYPSYLETFGRKKIRLALRRLKNHCKFFRLLPSLAEIEDIVEFVMVRVQKRMATWLDI